MKHIQEFYSYGQSEAVAQPPAETERPNNAYCFANGCPLPGGISESTKGGGPWLCRFHFLTQPKVWPRITEWVKGELASGKHPRELQVPRKEKPEWWEPET